MNLSEIFVKHKGGNLKLPKGLAWLPQPEEQEVVDGMQNDEEVQNLLDAKYKVIEAQYVLKHSKKDMRRKELKLAWARNKAIEIFILRWMCFRDDVVKAKNEIIQSQNIYDFSLNALSRQDLIDIYESQKGGKRFPTQAAYDFYMKTGKEPYSVI